MKTYDAMQFSSFVYEENFYFINFKYKHRLYS